MAKKIKRSGKIYTFQFWFTNPTSGDEDTLQFCAHTLEEADELFEEWCLNDCKWDSVPESTYDVVWEDCDAEEYGDEYGSPDDYAA